MPGRAPRDAVIRSSRRSLNQIRKACGVIGAAPLTHRSRIGKHSQGVRCGPVPKMARRSNAKRVRLGAGHGI